MKINKLKIYHFNDALEISKLMASQKNQKATAFVRADEIKTIFEECLRQVEFEKKKYGGGLSMAGIIAERALVFFEGVG